MKWPRKRRIKHLILTNRKYTFIFGAILGAFLAVILHIIQSISPLMFIESIWPASDKLVQKNSDVLNYENSKNYDFAYEKWLQENYKLKSCALNPDILRYTNQTEFEKCGKVGKSEESELENFIRDSDYFDPRTEAKFLYTKVSFLNGIFFSIFKESTMFIRNLRLY